MFYCAACSLVLDDSDDGIALPPIRVGTLGFCDSSCLADWAGREKPPTLDSLTVAGRVIVAESPSEGGVRWPSTLKDERTEYRPQVHPDIPTTGWSDVRADSEKPDRD